jgi:hypothetical protein
MGSYKARGLLTKTFLENNSFSAIMIAVTPIYSTWAISVNRAIGFLSSNAAGS